MKIKEVLFFSMWLIGFVRPSIENPCGVMIPRGGDEDWGIGAYLIPDEFEINIYRDTLGKHFGKFETYHSGLRLKDCNGKHINFNSTDLEWIAHYSNEMIKVKESSNPRFVKVLWKTIQGGLYLNKEELEVSGAIFQTYKDLLFKCEGSVINKDFCGWANIGVNLEKNCLNLRADPSINSTKILCVLGNDWEKPYLTHLKIMENNGNWAKVEYTEQHPPLIKSESDEDCTFIEKTRK